MFHYKPTFFLLFICFASCQQRPSKVARPVIQGFWEKQGDGQVLDISQSAIKFYDVTQKSCLPVKTIDLKNLAELGEVIKLTADSLVLKSGINRYQFTRLKALPNLCSLKKDTIDKDPVANFEVFWHTFNENYAFFEKRNIHWDVVYKTYRPKINHQTTDKELYKLFNEIIAKFNDGHITLDVPEALSSEGKTVNELDAAPKNRLPQTPEVSAFELRNALLKRYVKQPTSWGRDLYGNGLMNWGITKENVGYIQVNWMLFYRNYQIADSVKGDDYISQYFQKAGGNPLHMRQEVEQVRKIMDNSVTDLKDVDGIILDIRLNGGGYDGVALEILQHFINKKTIAFSKRTWLGKSFSDPTPIEMNPSGKRFLGPVILLTSHSTASAAEIAAMAAMGLKNFTRIGSSTEGIFSDRLEKKLPNGWSFSLSNQVYLNSANENFENIGIPPTLKVSYPREANEFRYSILRNLNKGDAAIDSAISLITKTRK